MSADATIVLYKIRLSIFSIDQANSALVLAPTIRPDPFKVWKPRRISVNWLKLSGVSCQCSYKGTISSRTSLASSINISLISGSASLASVGSDCAAVINGVNTSGISKSVNEAEKSVSTSKTSSKLLTESFMSRVSTCSVFKNVSSVDCVPSSSTALFFSTLPVEKLPSNASKPVLIGCWLIKLLLCKMVMAGSKLGGFCAAKSANIAGRCLVVSVTSATTSSVTGRVLSNRRLSKFSIDHAISLILKAPTIRPDPFKV